MADRPITPGATPVDDGGFVEVDSDQLPLTDITFECPHCSKSLSIEPRGAGLVIECTACHQLVTVPIPEGMELADIDSAPGEKEVQVASLRRALAKSEARVAELEAQVATLKEYRTTTERSRARTAHKFTELRGLSETVMKNQMELSGAVSKMLDIIVSDE
jgi:transcription elongation factor Elf1